MIKQIINHRSETIGGGALILAGFTIIGSILGVLRDSLFASRLGVGSQLDIYYAAFRIPDFVYSIFIMGAISAGFIPIFTAHLKKSKEEAGSLLSSIFVLFGLFMILVSALLIIFAEPILKNLLAGFDSEKISLAVNLTRLMMIQPIILGFSAIISSVLQIFKLFVATALAPAMYNLGIIAGIIFFYPRFGLSGLAYGVILGAILNLLILLPSFFHLKLPPKIDFLDSLKGLKQMFLIMIPRTLSILINQGYFLVLTFAASFMVAGSLGVFSLANNIQGFPYIIFTLSFVSASFPVFSRLFSDKDDLAFKQILNNTIRQILFFIIPFSGLFLIFRAQIVRLLLGYGRFDWAATDNTIAVLSILTLALVFQSLSYLFVRVFFSRGDSIKPFVGALLSYSLGAILCFILGRSFGVIGLAWAYVLTNTLYFFVMFIMLKRKLTFWSARELIKPVLKICISSFLACVVGYLMLNLLAPIFGTNTVKGLFLQAIFSGSSALFAFWMIGKKLGLEDLDNFKNLILNRLKLKK